ncbi:MAG: sugar phosphate isomerase/epimerase [Clostridia bacterium]|nr:sugar phosphate isomerase/epimerase [Clostridia bacterium]
MNIGLRLHDTVPGTLEERLAIAEGQGFACAHLAMSKVIPGFKMDDAPSLLTEELAREVKGRFAAHHMECAVLGCYLKLAALDEEERKKTQQIYRAHLRFGRMMGARVVGTETPASAANHWDETFCHGEEALELFIDSLRPVVQWAEEEDAIIAVEPVISHIVHTPERAERVLDAIRSDHLQIILDAINLFSMEHLDRADAIVEDAIGRLGDKVTVLHMKDYEPAPGEKRPRAIACGTGHMRYDTLLRFAKQRNLPMTLENTKPENAQATREYLEKLAAAL